MKAPVRRELSKTFPPFLASSSGRDGQGEKENRAQRVLSHFFKCKVLKNGLKSAAEHFLKDGPNPRKFLEAPYDDVYSAVQSKQVMDASSHMLLKFIQVSLFR